MKYIGILLAVLMLVGCQTNKVVVEKEIGLLQTVKERIVNAQDYLTVVQNAYSVPITFFQKWNS